MRTLAAAAPLLLLVVGCGGGELPVAEAPPPVPAPPPAASSEAARADVGTEAPKPTGPCASPSACRVLAKEATDGGAKAQHLSRACDLGDGEACTEAAQALVDRPGGAKGGDLAPLLEKGCAAKTGSSCNGLGQLFHRAGDDESAETYFRIGCDTGHGVSCHNLAALIMGGYAKMDHALLERARARACAAGEKEDCEPIKATQAAAAKGGTTKSASAPAVPGATLTVESMTADGVRVENLSCKVDGLGLLGAVVVVGTVAKQKAALRACGVSAPVPVTWTITHGNVTAATADTGNAKKDACVVAALKQVHSTSDGPCAARVGLQ